MSQPRTFPRRLSSGALGGLVGTLAHTGVMLGGHYLAPGARQEPTPPRQITEAAARCTAPEATRTAPRAVLGATVLHFGYGALAGAAYGPLVSRARERPLARGAAYGLGVWAASYLGWLPAAGLPPPATRQPAQQNVTMVLAHLAWGAVLGATVAYSRSRDGREC